MTSRVSPQEEQSCIKHSFINIHDISVVESMFTRSVINASEGSTGQYFSGRKRGRVKSGGESGPVPKKPLTRKTSIDNLFRVRTNSVDKTWKVKDSERSKGTTSVGSRTAEHSPTHAASSNALDAEGNPSTPQKFIFDDASMQYGSIGFPVYVYDCSLATLTDNIIFRSTSTDDDFFTDHRYDNVDIKDKVSNQLSECLEDGSEIPRTKHRSPEPKIEDSEFLPSKVVFLYQEL